MKINHLEVGNKVFVVRSAIVDRIWVDDENEPLIRLRHPNLDPNDYSSMFFEPIDNLVFDRDVDLDDENSLDFSRQVE